MRYRIFEDIFSVIRQRVLKCNRWISVMLCIDKENKLIDVACIDSNMLSNVHKFLDKAIRTVYSGCSYSINSFTHYCQQNVEKLVSAVLAIANGKELLKRIYFGEKYSIQSKPCNSEEVLQLQHAQRQTLDLKFRAQRELARNAKVVLVFTILMQNTNVVFSVRDLLRLMLVSRDSHRSVMQTHSRVSQLLRANRKKSPLQFGTLSNFVLSATGELYACGDNHYGQLGVGDTEYRNQFTRVPSLPKGTVVSDVIVDNDGTSTFVITDQGALYACGNNSHGQLGVGDAENKKQQFTPVVLPEGMVVRRVEARSHHTFIISTEGAVYACGANKHGQLGISRGDEWYTIGKFRQVPLPDGLSLPRGSFVRPTSLMRDAYNCVREYSSKFAAGAGAWKSFMSLSIGQLLLVPYMMRTREAEELNRAVYTVFKTAKEEEFPYNPEKNYLVGYREFMNTETDSHVEEKKSVNILKR